MIIAKSVFRFLLFILMIIPQHGQSQNLVQNSSFEAGLPDDPINSRKQEGIAGREFIKDWYVPTQSSPDIFNSPFSSAGPIPCAIARTGRGVVGLVLAESKNMAAHYGGSFKEYIQGTFSSPLVKGQKYLVAFYLALDRTSGFRAVDIGAYISADAIYRKDKLGFDRIPSISLSNDSLVTSANGWVRVSGIYTANGGERFITIGSFGDEFMQPLSIHGLKPKVQEGHTHRNAYYYIDDVSVIPYVDSISPERYFRQQPAEISILLNGGQDELTSSMRVWWMKMLQEAGKKLDPNTRISLSIAGDEFIPLIESAPVRDVFPLNNDLFSSVKPALKRKTVLEEAVLRLLAGMRSQSDGNRHLIILACGKQNFSGGQRDGMKAAWTSSKITSSLIQVGGGKSKELEALFTKIGGTYLVEDLNGSGAGFAEVCREREHFKDKVEYARARAKKTWYFLGATALLAVIIAGAV